MARSPSANTTNTAATAAGARANGRATADSAAMAAARRSAAGGDPCRSAQPAQARATTGETSDGIIWTAPICSPLKPSPRRYAAKNGM